MTTRFRQMDPEAAAVQRAIWRRKSPAEKIRMVNQLWQQARLIKRATLASLHPDWSSEELDQAVREAMSGRALDDQWTQAQP